MAINCVELAEAVLESELFGHVRGAFTDAGRDRKGVFRAADGGTLFLDEVGEMSERLQTKLLRVLEDGVVRPVGTTKDDQVDVRLITATHRDLNQRVAEKRFREDLYYRLNVLNVEIPPLRDRGNDILLLARHFLQQHLETGHAPRFCEEATRKMVTYSWPGNVRELSNVMQRFAVLLDTSEIDVACLPEQMRFRLLPERRSLTLAEVEQEHVRAVYAARGGNQTQTAKALGIARETLRRKLRTTGVLD